MNNFYLTLLSDSSLSTFSKNTQCDFKVKLDHSIQIEKDNWEVGLVEVITPAEVNNITIENNYVILRFSDRKMCEEIYLTPVKTQLLQYILTPDLMLFYHSNKIKA